MLLSKENTGKENTGKTPLKTSPLSYLLSSRYAGLLVGFLTGAAFLMRRKGLATQSLWFDEADLLVRAQRDLGVLLGDFVKPGENGPLYTLFMHFWVKVAGTGEAALRTPSLLAGTAVVPLIYLLGQRLGGKPVGLFAAALVTVSPYQLWYSQDAKMYPLAMLLTLASVYLFLTALEKNEAWRWTAYVFLTTLSFYVHLMSVLIVAVEVVYYLLLRRAAGRAGSSVAGRKGTLSLALLTLPYLPIAVWQARALWDGGLGKTWFQPVGLLEMLDTLGRRFGVNRIPDLWWESVGALFFAVLAGLGLVVAWRTERASRPPVRPALLLTLYLLFPVLAFYLLTMRIPLFAERYLLIASPAYYLLVAGGLAWLARQRWPLALVTGLIGLIFAAGALFSFNYSEEPQKEDWREAMRWLQTQLRPGDEVIVMPGYMRSVVDYYLKPNDVPVYTVPQNLWDGQDQRGLFSYLAAENGILRSRERAWLVTSPERYKKDEPTEYLRKVWFNYNTWMFQDPRVHLGVDIYGYAFKQIPGTDKDFYSRANAGKIEVKFGESLLLEGYDITPTDSRFENLPAGQVRYDSYLHLTLYWRKLENDPTDYQVRVRLLDQSGHDTGTTYLNRPLGGYYPTGQWKTREAVRDYRDLYIKVPPGQYRLEIMVYPTANPLKPLTPSGVDQGRVVESKPELNLNWPVQVLGATS